MKETARLTLPDSVVHLFDDIVEQRVLGASNHIKMIGEMIEAIALDGKERNIPLTDIIDHIKTITDYFIATRGQASQAISNAIYIMIHNIDMHCDLEMDQAIEKIIEQKDSYLVESKENIEKIVDISVKMAADMNSILVYDYSSTVEKFLYKLKENNKSYTIYIPESRIIDGGRHYIKVCREGGFSTRFIPDASIMYYLRDCDAAFMGAESFYANGTGFNTTGSDIVGLVCHYYHIPLYFLTPMVKLDIRPTYGEKKDLVMNDVKSKLDRCWNHEIDTTEIDFKTPELIGVPPEQISAFITEEGVIPAQQMYMPSLNYSKQLKEG